jgi:hypothetical protein
VSRKGADWFAWDGEKKRLRELVGRRRDGIMLLSSPRTFRLKGVCGNDVGLRLPAGDDARVGLALARSCDIRLRI